MLAVIVATAYGFSVVSFALFVYFVLRRPQPGANARELRAEGVVADVAALVEALARLTDSLSRAGPAVVCLLAALFFFMAALYGAGLDAPTG
jgi:hypothetical protein